MKSWLSPFFLLWSIYIYNILQQEEKKIRVYQPVTIIYTHQIFKTDVNMEKKNKINIYMTKYKRALYIFRRVKVLIT